MMQAILNSHLEKREKEGDYDPQFTEVFEKYTWTFLNKNFWRVQHLMDWEDAMQEGRLTFVTVVYRLRKNGSYIDGPAHMMQLYKTALYRHFHTLANKDTKREPEVAMSQFVSPHVEDGDDDYIINTCLNNPFNNEYNMIEFYDKLRRSPYIASRIIVSLVEFQNNPPMFASILELLSCNESDRRRNNVALCDMLGFDPDEVNVHQEVRNYLYNSYLEV